jgi:tripartite-type tricarboxylate transporter receptor subunit TctC
MTTPSQPIGRSLPARVAAAAFISLLATAAEAQPNYPTKPVQMITPAAAGNGPDVVTRVIADQLTKLWKEQVLVINKAGASGLLAANVAATAPPDGYTLYASNLSSIVALPVNQKLSFDMDKTFRPLGITGDQPMIIGVAPSLGIKSLGELMELAKKTPGGIPFAATTRDSIPHYTMELLLMETGAPMTYVFYSGTAQAMTDVIAGRLPVVVDGFGAMAGAIANGSIVPLAVTSPKRLPNFPNLAAVSETVPNFGVTSWFPLLAPANTPDEIVQKISKDLQTVTALAETQEKLGKLGTYRNTMRAEDMAPFMVRERARWLPAIKKVFETAPK